MKNLNSKTSSNKIKISIKELCNNKPSNAIDFMIAGLERQSKRNNFIVDMSDYGAIKDDICFGCAATCTLQEITQKNFIDRKILFIDSRAEFLNIDSNELHNFEFAIDQLRRGNEHAILKFFGVPIKKEIIEDLTIIQLTELDNHNWKKNIYQYNSFSCFLKSIGY